MDFLIFTFCFLLLRFHYLYLFLNLSHHSVVVYLFFSILLLFDHCAYKLSTFKTNLSDNQNLHFITRSSHTEKGISLTVFVPDFIVPHLHFWPPEREKRQIVRQQRTLTLSHDTYLLILVYEVESKIFTEKKTFPACQSFLLFFGTVQLV